MKIGGKPKRAHLFYGDGLRGMDSKGYTMIELLIVMSVTLVLFVSTIVLFNGRIQRTQFQQSVRDLDLRIQDVFNQVSTGNFTGNNNFVCRLVGGVPRITDGVQEQGTNSDCIFIGKVIHFGVADSNCSATNPRECDTLAVLTIAGRRRVSSGGNVREVATLREAQLTVIRSLSDVKTTAYGLSPTRIVTNGENIAAVGVFSALSNASTGIAESATQRIWVVPINGTQLGQSSEDIEAAIRNANETNAGQRIVICLQGTANQAAAIVINDRNRQTSTDVLFEGSIPTECGG